ncbi:hypothetical protein HDK77DRAFT_441758 [Phyllosticta capitalensis]
MESCCDVVQASNLRLIRHICGFAKCQPTDQKPGRLPAPVPPDQQLNSYLMAVHFNQREFPYPRFSGDRLHIPRKRRQLRVGEAQGGMSALDGPAVRLHTRLLTSSRRSFCMKAPATSRKATAAILDSATDICARLIPRQSAAESGRIFSTGRNVASSLPSALQRETLFRLSLRLLALSHRFGLRVRACSSYVLPSKTHTSTRPALIDILACQS